MHLDHSAYEGPDDFLRLLAFLSETNALDSTSGRLQPGDLTWWTRQNMAFSPQRSLQLFGVRDRLLGFVFSDSPTWAVIQAHPALPPEAIAQLVRAAERRAGIPPRPGDLRLTVRVFEADTSVLKILTSRRYVVTGPESPQFSLDLRDRSLPMTVPPGFQIRSVRDSEAELSARVELHCAVWHPSRVSLAAYSHLRQALTYRADLDLVAVTADGRMASYALGWYDPATRTAVFEPVGTHPAFRGLGLAGAVLEEGLRRFRTLGALRVMVSTGGKNEAAIRLYHSAGFREVGRHLDFQSPPLEPTSNVEKPI